MPASAKETNKLPKNGGEFPRLRSCGIHASACLRMRYVLRRLACRRSPGRLLHLPSPPLAGPGFFLAPPRLGARRFGGNKVKLPSKTLYKKAVQILAANDPSAKRSTCFSVCLLFFWVGGGGVLEKTTLGFPKGNPESPQAPGPQIPRFLGASGRIILLRAWSPSRPEALLIPPLRCLGQKKRGGQK